MEYAPPICLKCKHYHRDKVNELTCEAYPDGIPDEILQSVVDHTESYEGDHGIQFEERKEN